jgi:hypothetical protein
MLGFLHLVIETASSNIEALNEYLRGFNACLSV